MIASAQEKLSANRAAPRFPPKPLRALLNGLAEVAPRDDRAIAGLSLDSRSIAADELFIALAGEKHDGRDFIKDAVTAGAAAIAREKPAAKSADTLNGRARMSPAVPSFEIHDLRARVSAIAARFFEHPSRNMRVIGVTGTNGKTTCAYLLAQGLHALGQRCALMGTLGTGFVDALRPATLTTPDAIATQRIMAEFCAEHARAVCVEVSSHALSQGRVNQVEFDVAVLTNLSRDHLDYHRDMRSYARAKEKLFRAANLGAAVINIDDEFGRKILQRHSAKNCLRYGLRGGDVRAHDIRLSARGTAFDIAYRNSRARLHSKLIGAVNVPNLLAAASALIACGFSVADSVAALSNCAPPPGRLEMLRADDAEDSPGVVIDYAHTPDALARVLDSLKQLCRGRLWLVFGCAGDRDRGKRAQMGAIAERGAARIIVTDDNPRSEDPGEIAAQVASGMNQPPLIIHDRRRAIHAALAAAAPQDIVLVAGKGHETTQSAGARVLAFNDRAVALDALESLSAAAAVTE